MRLLDRFLHTLRGRAPVARARRNLIRPTLETLEDRSVPSVVVESFDGSGNNLAHSTWGATGTDLLRLAPAQYADGISTPGGVGRPDARTISNAVAAEPATTPTNDRMMSAFIYAWGQFVDHDIDLTSGASPRQTFNIPVPTGDPQFDPFGTGTQVIPLSRSNYDPTTGTGAGNPRQQVNSITAWVDGSQIYGSDATRAAALRSFSGGKLKTSSGDLLPFNTAGLANANDAHVVPNSQLFLAGDVRANENPELTALQTLFVREHNRLADTIAKANPGLSDEAIYQQARQIVIGELQAITYNEFLPALLGPDALRPYTGYHANVNPGIANEFSTSAFRVGHTLVGDDIEFLDNNGNAVRPAIALANAFFDPRVVEQTGIDPILKYLASDRAQEVDTKVVDGLRNFLFGPPGAGGMDLAALNIQRGRDHGLADYNTTRAAYGLPKVNSFAQITSNTDLQAALQKLYGNVNNIDLWVGGLAEGHVRGGSVGALFERIIADQFTRLRDGDRFFFERVFSGRDLQALEHTTLADVIQRNSGVRNIQDNVFYFKASVTGRVFQDGNGDGRMNPGELGLSGRVVQLLGLDGTVIMTTTTQADGGYRFDGLEIGSYRVREVPPPGSRLTTPPPPVIAITRGMTVACVDFGEAPLPPARSATPDLVGGLIWGDASESVWDLLPPRRKG